MKGFGGGERDVGEAEAAPVHVDRGLGVAFKVGGAEGEDVLAVLSFSDGDGRGIRLILGFSHRAGDEGEGTEGEGRGVEEGEGGGCGELTERRHRPKCNHTPNPASPPTPSDKNTSPYSAE